MLQHIITYGDYWLPASILVVLFFFAVATTVLIRAKKDDAPTSDTEREAEDYDSDSLQRRAW
ncbi:MAG: hypothetical protein ACJ788_10090 [Ktedonobacteraceae bacterium]